MRKMFVAAGIVFCLAAEVPLLHAQEHASKSESGEASEESPAQIAFKWANLVILLAGFGYLLKKPAKEFFETRKKEIASGLEQAKVAQENSSRRINEIEQRLSRMSDEIGALRVQADAESARERENIIAEATRDMDRLVEQSRQEIDRIARGIERGIREKLADAVVDHASRTLETQMTEDDQKRVVVRFLKKV